MLINKENIKSMRHLLEQMEAEWKGRRIMRYMEEKEVVEVYSEQFFGQVRERARMIEASNLQGKHIGMIGKNSCEWLSSLCAIFYSGAVAVLLDQELSADMAAELIKKADIDAIFYDDVEENMKLRCLDHNKKEADHCVGEQTENEKLSCIFFTSGTTGESRAVMLSEAGLIASVCAEVNEKAFQTLLAVLPLHHMAGFLTVLNTFYIKKEVCIATELKYFYRYLECMKPDYVFVVPSMFKMLAQKLKKATRHGENLGWNLHMIGCGGAAFYPEFLQLLMEKEIVVIQTYGASEAGAIGFLWEMTLERPDTIGKPPSCLETKIVNGELYLRSKAIMMGYYKDPEATKEVLKDGWCATGDLCRVDEEGYYYLTGRKKNLIILSNGENVSPEEIEKKLSVCEEIEEIMIGVEGDWITANIYPRYQENMEEEQRKWLREKVEERIEDYNESSPVSKQIQRIHFQEEPFTKTAIGKMIRGSVTGVNTI